MDILAVVKEEEIELIAPVSNKRLFWSRNQERWVVYQIQPHSQHSIVLRVTLSLEEAIRVLLER